MRSSLQHDPRTDAGLGAQRFGKVEMAGDLQRRHLLALPTPETACLLETPLFPAEVRSFHANPLFRCRADYQGRGKSGDRDFARILIGDLKKQLINSSACTRCMIVCGFFVCSHSASGTV